jgi:hypothetical protein
VTRHYFWSGQSSPNKGGRRGKNEYWKRGESKYSKKYRKRNELEGRRGGQRLTTIKEGTRINNDKQRSKRGRELTTINNDQRGDKN